MMIMPANNTSHILHYYAGKYPGSVGMLITPHRTDKIPHYMPYAVDNGAYSEWIPDKFKKLLGRISLIHKPLWVLCPDVVGDRDATLRLWDEWSPYLTTLGFPLAFAAQDEMTEKDVPENAFCVFVGGSTRFKLDNAHKFKGIAKWLHIGRVNTANRLTWAKEIGADSVDGTGFFRGGINRLVPLIDFIEGSNQESLEGI